MKELRKRMISDLIVRGLSQNTQELYLRSVTQLANYYRRSPDQISEREIQDYLVHLSQERRLAWGTCNVASHGLRFFYQVTLGRSETLCQGAIQASRHLEPTRSRQTD